MLLAHMAACLRSGWGWETPLCMYACVITYCIRLWRGVARPLICATTCVNIMYACVTTRVTELIQEWTRSEYAATTIWLAVFQGWCESEWFRYSDMYSSLLKWMLLTRLLIQPLFIHEREDCSKVALRTINSEPPIQATIADRALIDKPCGWKTTLG